MNTRTRRSKAKAPAPDELEEVFAAVAKYFGLLSEPTRLKILHAICQAELSVGAIVAATGVGQTSVSRHLALLHQAGAVSRQKVGNSALYKVDDPEFIEICRTVCVQIASRIDARVPLREDLLGVASRHPVAGASAAAAKRRRVVRTAARGD
jgi:DNA-binding transcriptional ArsR family regulator